MFKNLKLSTKITAGFGIVTLFLIIVGITGYVSLQSVTDQINVMQKQITISNKTNTALNEAQTGQAGALRYLLYRDSKYDKIREKDCNAAIVAASEARDMITSPERKGMLERVVQNLEKYQGTCVGQKQLFEKMQEIGNIRSEAAGTLFDSIKNAIVASTQKMETDKQEVDGKTLTNWDAVDQNLKFQELRNSYNRIYQNAYSYMLTTDQAKKQSFEKAWRDEMSYMGEKLSELSKEIKDPQLLEAIKTSQKSLAIYKTQTDAFLQACVDLRDLQINEQQPAANAVIAESCSAREGIFKRVQEVEKQAKDTASWATFLIVAMGISAFGLSIVIAFFLIRSITKPIIRVAEMLTSGAEQTTSAAGQVSSSSQSLAQGASEQAASLEETTASMEEMASMTSQNADNAAQAKKLAEVAWSSAEKGTEAMHRMSSAIDDIKKSSDETAKIIKTIDEIAFQTNLLALNAAVEAARAGEAGKGFAVVAEEVRNLAQRSAEAARSTSDMIADSVKNADNGVAISREVAEALTEIADGSRKVNDLVGEIAAASNEQSQGIEQINTAVNQMDQVTQSNAASAEESASASEELSAQAEELNSMVQELQAIVGGTTIHSGSTRTNARNKKSSSQYGKKASFSSSSASTNGQKSKSKDPEELIPLNDEMELASF